MSESPRSDAESENEFDVEKILKKRIRNGVVQYYLKWRGFDSSHNSWESEGDLNCFELIEEFEEEWEKKRNLIKNLGKKRKTPSKLHVPAKKYARSSDSEDEVEKEHPPPVDQIENPPVENAYKPFCKIVPRDLEKSNSYRAATSNNDEEDLRSGFDRGLEPDRIVGASDVTGEMVYLMQWKDGGMELITGQEAKDHCALLVCDFFEANLVFGGSK